MSLETLTAQAEPTPRDPRLTPARDDLAAAHLEGAIAAARYVEGRRCQVSAPVLDLKRHPRPDAALDTQVLHGECLRVYDEEDGWAWVQAEQDDYVGYVAARGLTDAIVESTHRVIVRRTFVYPAPDMKTPILFALPLASRVAIRDIAGAYAKLDGGGYIYAAHLAGIDDVREHDIVIVAERLCGTPYLWGGRTPQGIDCSGLVQLSFALAGVSMPRDTHRQERVGHALPARGGDGEGLARGDLVFWPGHVGIMSNSTTLLHANAHHMLVCKEPLRDARERIAGSASASIVSSIRRQIR